MIINRISCIQELSNMPLLKINYNNWNLPYQPNISFQIGHSGNMLMIHFFVKERYTMALVDKDNGKSWTDSCLEIFIKPDKSLYYYNLEFTCIGKLLMSIRKEKHNYINAPIEVLNTIERVSSLGKDMFSEKIGDNTWDLLVSIPITSLFKHNFNSWDEIINCSMNFYKCGDNLSEKHYLSWKPIYSSSPDFHLPQYFGKIEFETKMNIINKNSL